MPKAIFFDVGETLILGHPKYWLWPLLQERGVAERANVAGLRQAITTAFDSYNARHMQAQSVEAALPIWRDFHHTLLEGIGLPELADEISTYLAQNWQDPRVWPLVPEAQEVLGTLKEKGYRLAVVSNWDGLLPGILQAVGLAKYFDHVSASALVGYAKPDPRIFQHTLQALSLEPNQAWHIGDSLTADVQGAQNAGLRGVLFDPYAQNPNAVHRLSQLLEMLED